MKKLDEKTIIGRAQENQCLPGKITARQWPGRVQIAILVTLPASAAAAAAEIATSAAAAATAWALFARTSQVNC
jgi:hypothetical protein